jgi:excisionase family DNA binding protein
MIYVKKKLIKAGKTKFGVKYLSNLLGVHRSTVTRYIQSGKLKGKKSCGAYLIKRSDFFHFLDLYNYYS